MKRLLSFLCAVMLPVAAWAADVSSSLPSPENSVKFILDPTSTVKFNPINISARFFNPTIGYAGLDGGDGKWIEIGFSKDQTEINKEYIVKKTGDITQNNRRIIDLRQDKSTLGQPKIYVKYYGFSDASEARITYLAIPQKAGDELKLKFKILLNDKTLIEGSLDSTTGQGPPPSPPSTTRYTVLPKKSYVGPPPPPPSHSAKFTLDPSSSVAFNPINFFAKIEQGTSELFLGEEEVAGSHSFTHITQKCSHPDCMSLGITFRQAVPVIGKEYIVKKSNSTPDPYVRGKQIIYFAEEGNWLAQGMMVRCVDFSDATEAHVTYLKLPEKPGDELRVKFAIMLNDKIILAGIFDGPADKATPPPPPLTFSTSEKPDDRARFTLDPSSTVAYNPLQYSVTMDNYYIFLSNEHLQGLPQSRFLSAPETFDAVRRDINIQFMLGVPTTNKEYRVKMAPGSQEGISDGELKNEDGSTLRVWLTNSAYPFTKDMNVNEIQITYLSVPEKIGDMLNLKLKVVYSDGKFTQGSLSAPISPTPPPPVMHPAKPVIYLYPPVTEKVKVELDYKGGLRATYPAYDPAIKGWSVTAHPDGTLVNDADGKEYSYLFWDGKSYDFPIDTGEGFVVKGSDTAKFLQKTLAKLGLTPKEYNEFIVYWLPKMQDNPYNFIRFAGREYTNTAPLTVTPKPDSMLRVFMIYKLLQEPIRVKEQKLPAFNRHGFAVVEWGGSEISGN